MKEEDFVKLYGETSQRVESNFTGKVLTQSLNTADACIEFCDNAYDAKLQDEIVTVNFEYCDEKHFFKISDNASGISDMESFYTLGGSNKEKGKKIGKYGIGAQSAILTIIRENRYNKMESCLIHIFSKSNGIQTSQSAFVDENLCLRLGEIKRENIDDTQIHGTEIIVTNISMSLTVLKDISENIEKYYEIPLADKDISIMVQGRNLGEGISNTFSSCEKSKHIKVCGFPVEVKSIMIMSNEQSERDFEKTDLRLYDKNSKRLLDMDRNYWKWFADIKSEQAICGLRTGVFIDSSLGCYNVFGVAPSKNKITYKKYHSKPGFEELKETLKFYYNQAHKGKDKNNENNKFIDLDGESYCFNSASTITDFYTEKGDGLILLQKKYTNIEIAKMIKEIRSLRKQNSIARK